jgi:PAS domain S-box-containing protein
MMMLSKYAHRTGTIVLKKAASQQVITTRTAGTRALGTSIWSNSYSFASPEADFVGQRARENDASDRSSHPPVWSEQISFASPEADFTSEKVNADTNTSNQAEWSGSLSFASPESDFTNVANNKTDDHFDYDSPSSYQPNMPSSFELLTSPQTAIGVIHFGEFLDEATKALLRERYEHKTSLPTTMADALADPRPIVITSTSSPFVVFDVNEAWVGLCGYSREEALDKNLGDLLQGPDTDPKALLDMVARLRHGSYGEAKITNYAKNGRKFQNHVKVGSLSTENGDAAEYFIGVLEEIRQDNNNQEGSKMSM